MVSTITITMFCLSQLCILLPFLGVISGCNLTKVDLAFILDASTSVTQVNFDLMLQFAKAIVDKANVDNGSVRVGSLVYSNKVEIKFYLDQYTTNNETKTAIGTISYVYGSTNTADALQEMHTKLFDRRRGDRADAENVAIVITDGISNINRRRTIPEADLARSKGITIYAIGVGLKDTRELKGMAYEPTSEYVFNIQQFDELSGLVETIFCVAKSFRIAKDVDERRPTRVNEEPVADADYDVNIHLPIDNTELDGSKFKSTDDVDVMRT